MKDKRRKAAAKIYWRIVKKAGRKIDKLSPEEKAAWIEKEQARLGKETADLKAKADELPALRAENERLERQLWERLHDLATLAAQFYSSDDTLTVDQAAELAFKQMAAVKAIISPPALVAAAKAAKTPVKNEPADVGMRYEEFANYVTDLRKSTQAVGRFEEFLGAQDTGKPDGWLEAKLATYRSYGKAQKLKRSDAEPLKRTFAQWWKVEKSSRAKKGGKASAKQRKAEAAKRICPECGKYELESRKRLCRYCSIRAKVVGVGYSQDFAGKDVADVEAHLAGAASGKTPQRRGEY